MKEKREYWILLVVLLAWLTVSCAAPQTRFVEAQRAAVVNNPQVRALAPYIFSNRYSATNADIRIYDGWLDRKSLIGNVNGQPVIYNDYIDKFRVDNAFGPNDATVVKRLLDPSRQYTALAIINWGAFGKIYGIYVFHLRPTKDATKTVWTGPRGWDSAYVNNYVEVSGSDEPAYNNQLRVVWTIYPNEIVRRAIFGKIR